MGCDISDRDYELLSPSPSVSVGGNSKRFNLPQKFFEDCNGVGHALVPRKLRSAMKKRRGGSISPTLPASKKLNRKIGGIESPKKDGVKKSKLNVKQGDSDWSPSKAVSGTITKDEEEVIETLYALAGMFTKDDETNRSKVGDEALEAKPSTFLEASQGPMTAFEDSSVVKVDFDSICSSRTGEASDPLSNVERSSKGTVKVNSLNEPSVQVELLELHNSKSFQMELDSSTSHVNLHGMPLFSKSEPADRKPVYNSVSVCVPSELSPSTGILKLHKQKESSLMERKQVLSLEQAAADGSQLDQHHSTEERKRNGPALWPGLSSTVSHGAGSHGPPLQSPAAKICASRRDSFENGCCTKKVPRVAADRRSLKRCAAHVSISRLIRDLQTPERKDMVPLQPDQLRPHEGSNQGVHMVAHNFNGETNDLNGVISAVRIENSVTTKNQNEARSGTLEHTRPHQDQQQAALASGFCSSQKQSFNFLSLSAGAGGVAANSSTSRDVNVSEMAQQFHIPYLHSFSQHQNFLPFSLHSTCHSSSALVDQISATQQVQQPQLPPYLGSPFGALTKQQLLMLQQQQQQQRLWAAQLAAQYRSVGTSTYIAPFPTLQNGVQDSSSLNPHAQTILPQSASWLEVLGSKYSPISPEQQPQLIALTSPLPTSRLKRQDHHLTSAYEDPRGRSRAVQLLCNERL